MKAHSLVDTTRGILLILRRGGVGSTTRRSVGQIVNSCCSRRVGTQAYGALGAAYVLSGDVVATVRSVVVCT